MKRSLAELESMVRDRICSVCSDRTEEGGCGLTQPSSCALFRLFPQVAKAIQSVESNDIKDYIRAIRSDVCTICIEQTPEGSCEMRHRVECALDAYLVLVVQVIEEATGKRFAVPSPF